MGFFDPPHKKILDWSPASFRAGAAVWGAALEAALLSPDIPPSAHKLFRTAVVGSLALEAAEASPADWSPKGVRLIQVYTRNAVNLIPTSHETQASRVLDAVHEAIRDFTLHLEQARRGSK